MHKHQSANFSKLISRFINPCLISEWMGRLQLFTYSVVWFLFFNACINLSLSSGWTGTRPLHGVYALVCFVICLFPFPSSQLFLFLALCRCFFVTLHILHWPPLTNVITPQTTSTDSVLRLCLGKILPLLSAHELLPDCFTSLKTHCQWWWSNGDIICDARLVHSLAQLCPPPPTPLADQGCMVHSCACRLLLSVTEILSVCGGCGIAHCPHSSLSLDTGSLLYRPLSLSLNFTE